MFILTADVNFEGFQPVKPAGLKWRCSVDEICDTASIQIPAMCRLIDKDKTYEHVPTGLKMVEGSKVEIYAGYDGNNHLQFTGFVKRINFKVPLEIDCEGYSYQLRRKIINKSFGRTTVREVLNFLIADTDIVLSTKNPDKIIFEPAVFKNYTGLQILEWLKEKYLLTVFFQGNELYAGWRATYTGKEVKHRLNWNVIKDDELLFNTYTGSTVHIEMVTRTESGQKRKAKALNVQRPGNVKQVKTTIQDQEDMQLAANDRQHLENKKGYSGALTGYLLTCPF